MNLMDFPGESSPASWEAPNGQTWHFLLVEEPIVAEGVECGTDFVWLRINPDKGLPDGFREPRIGGFKEAAAPDPANWWKSK